MITHYTQKLNHNNLINRTYATALCIVAISWKWPFFAPYIAVLRKSWLIKDIIITSPLKRQKIDILDELDDFINETCIVKRTKKSQGLS